MGVQRIPQTFQHPRHGTERSHAPQPAKDQPAHQGSGWWWTW
jgi:hypothetical protein